MQPHRLFLLAFSIVTARLLLRPFALTDAGAVFAYASRPAFSRRVAYDGPADLAQTTDFLRNVLMSQDRGALVWALQQLGDPAAVGAIMMTRERADRAELHYDIADWLYGLGLMTEAVRAVLPKALLLWTDVRTVVANTAATNIGSRRVLEKSRFDLVARRREQWPNHADEVDVLYYEAEGSTLLASRDGY